jgi:hypothetical protein
MTNEPDDDQTAILTECHDAALVTAKSDVDAGLDNGVNEALDERERLLVSASATALVLDVSGALLTALNVERVECGARPPLGRNGPQIADPTADTTIDGGNLTIEPSGGDSGR